MNKKRLNWLFISLLGLSALLAGEQWLENELSQTHLFEQRLETLDDVGTLTARIQGAISSNLTLVHGLASAMEASEQLTEKEFNFVAKQLMSQQNQLRNIAIAPGMVIKFIYPRKGNEAALGLNYLEHPIQSKAATQARDTGSMVLAGPFELVQGGKALIGRIPYYRPAPEQENGKIFAGLVSAVLDSDAIFERIELGKFDEELDLAIFSSDEDGNAIAHIFGNPQIFESNPVTAVSHFSPESHWVVAATPKGGWAHASPLLPLTRQVFVVIATILAWLIVYKYRMTERLLQGNRSLEREVAVRREAEMKLSQNEQRYRDISESMADWIWEVDSNGRYIFASGNIKGTLGLEPEELIGMTPFDFMPPEEAERISKLFIEIVEERKPIVDLENWNLNRNGEAICLLTNGVPVFQDGKFCGYRGIDKDITRQKQAEALFRQQQEELQLKQQQLEGLIENAPAVVYLKDLDGRYTLVNRRYAELLGKGQESFIGLRDDELHQPAIAEQLMANDRHVLSHGKASRYEETLRIDSSTRTYETIKFPLFDSKNEIVALCGISTDITERKQNEDNLQLFKKVVESANEAVVITDLNGVITHINPAYEAITGFTQKEVVGNSPALIKSGVQDTAFYEQMWTQINEDGHWEGEIWDRRKTGELFPKWLSINTVYDTEGKPSYHVGIFTDISDKKRTEEKLLNLAYYDPLTQLPNRSLFYERLEHELVTSRRKNEMLAVLFIDIDRFKNINDTFGHTAGDQLLVTMAERIRSAIRESDTVARLGGDEFTVILTELGSDKDVSRIANTITERLYQPIKIQQNEIRVGGSIGIAMYPDDGMDCDTLSKKADMAMYQAKSLGRNTFQFFSAEMNRHVAERVALEGELHQALENSEFEVFYQPKYRFSDEKLSGMESLIRWRHPKRGLVSPGSFIPVAEDSGLILPIGDLVLEQTCRQLAKWGSILSNDVHIAVNLSATQFSQKDLIKSIEAVLDVTGVSPEQLEMEITESTIVADAEQAIATMHQLRELGLSLAIDDFGTGYSSLNYLKRFPLNTLKIDRSFIQDITVSSNDAAIVKAIIAMAHSLNLKVVAEGVETREQFEYLREEGCHEAQGYYLSRPIAAVEMTKHF